MTTLYVIAGDPQRQLTPTLWREYVAAVWRSIEKHATHVQGSWQSADDAPPSACIAVRVPRESLPLLRSGLSSVRAFYGLHSVTLAVVDTHLFL